MSRFVAIISVCFQGFQIVAGRSTRHGRDMTDRKKLSRKWDAQTPCPILKRALTAFENVAHKRAYRRFIQSATPIGDLG
jgi:hypothetical protein